MYVHTTHQSYEPLRGLQLNEGLHQKYKVKTVAIALIILKCLTSINLDTYKLHKDQCSGRETQLQVINSMYVKSSISVFSIKFAISLGNKL